MNVRLVVGLRLKNGLYYSEMSVIIGGRCYRLYFYIRQTGMEVSVWHFIGYTRMRISQAIVEELTLLSADSKFDRYEVNIIWQ